MAKTTPPEFFDWLDDRLRERDLTDNSLAQKAHVSQSVISKGRSGIQAIGWDAGVAIAVALGEHPEVVLRRLGLLPPAAADQRSILIDELLTVYPELPEADQEDLLQLARSRLERHKREVRRGQKQTT